jgi:hypothetical protein
LIKTSDNKFLNSLVQDCITFRLTEIESLEYIKTRYGKSISAPSFNRRKANVSSELSTETWLTHFTRIGYVKNHQQDIETISKIRDDSIHQLKIEIDRQENRDEYKILKLKADIRDNTQLLSELNLGTPIISAIKAKLESKNDSNTTTLQVSQ